MHESIIIFWYFIKELNNEYADFLLFLVTALALWFVYEEYVLKRRPFIFPELTFEKKGDDWYFHFLLQNAGTYPVLTKIDKAKLTIGDEVYPTEFHSEMLIPVGKNKKLVPVGHINKIGRDKVINNKYKNNRVEVEFRLESKPIGSKTYKYSTSVTYEINVEGNIPVIKVIFERFS